VSDSIEVDYALIPYRNDHRNRHHLHGLPDDPGRLSYGKIRRRQHSMALENDSAMMRDDRDLSSTIES